MNNKIDIVHERWLEQTSSDWDGAADRAVSLAELEPEEVMKRRG